MSKKQKNADVQIAELTAAVARLTALVEGGKQAKVERPAKAGDLKVLSKSEIHRLRAKNVKWVRGLADWQLQGRKRPANAIATGAKVSKATLAKHGYRRPEGHVADKLRAYKG